MSRTGDARPLGKAPKSLPHGGDSPERPVTTLSQADLDAVRALLLGPRTSEVVQRDVRDLDDGGRLLWIPDSKTESGKRTLEVPELLQPLLLALAHERIGAAPLFVDRHGERPTRWWLGYHCKVLCTRAGVPVITPHGLRGTHGSIARRGGATGEIVAAQFGHASSAITNRVYIQPEVSQAAQTTAVLHAIAGGKR